MALNVTLMATMAAMSSVPLGRQEAIGDQFDDVPPCPGGQVVEVSPPLGAIRGCKYPYGQLYRGIPFANPPVGLRRWGNPEPVSPWAEPVDAFDLPPGCPQTCILPPQACPPILEEDCLYLNVFAPSNSQPGDKLPVMVFFHGGAWFIGYSGEATYDGAHMANEHGVVVVTTNYRLGMLGFMKAGEIDGNFAIKDQQESLRWVRGNIEAFGGDPDAVTIFGQSAGALSVATHMVDNTSEPLFQAAIMESNPWSIPFRTPKMQEALAKGFAREAKCAPETNPEWVECLRARTTEDLVEAQRKAQLNVLTFAERPMDAFMAFTPTLGDEPGQYPIHPLEAFAQGKMQDKPYISGTCAQDGIVFPFMVSPLSDIGTLDYDAFGNWLFEPEKWLEILGQYPAKHYGGDRRVAMGDMITHGLFQCANRHAILGPRKEKSWVYLYDHVASFGNQTYPAPRYTICRTNACHASELWFVFDATGGGVIFTPDEQKMSERFMTRWTNFAHSHNPNDPTGEQLKKVAMLAARDPVNGPAWLQRAKIRAGSINTWPHFDGATEEWLRIKAAADVVQYRNDTTTCEWWDSTLGYQWW